MVEKKFASVPSDVDVETNAARADLDNQIAELRTEISRLTETVSAIGTGAKAVVTSEDRRGRLRHRLAGKTLINVDLRCSLRNGGVPVARLLSFLKAKGFVRWYPPDKSGRKIHHD
jgi:hypothetical protein